MTGFNYPNHPLFRIAPLLDKGFQTVQFDPYERVLVAKIRAGQYSSDLWDCNGIYLDYADRIGSPAYRQKTAFKSRYEMTPERRAEYLKAVREEWLALAEEREQRAQERAAKNAEKERVRREWEEEQERQQRAYAERQERQRAEKAQRDREWAEREAEVAGERAERSARTEQWRKEREAILASSWECARCLTPSIVMPWAGGKYQLTCPRCVRSATADHAALVEVMVARNARPEPAIVGYELLHKTGS